VAASRPDDPSAGSAQRASANIQLADDEALSRNTAAAQASYEAAISLARRDGDSKLQGLAPAHLGDLQEQSGDVKAAAASYQQGLALDEKAADPGSAAFDWFNYGQFLRRHGLPDELSYACFLHAEARMAGTGGGNLETVESIRRQVETRLGSKAAGAKTNLPTLLARATQLPVTSFSQ
jgi:Tfp pilus assembly protein PilF